MVRDARPMQHASLACLSGPQERAEGLQSGLRGQGKTVMLHQSLVQAMAPG